MSEEFYSLAITDSNPRGRTNSEEGNLGCPIIPEELHEDSEPEVQMVHVQPVNRIESLAKPKKSSISAPVRLKAKKKVVAFGHTTNISQTVEGTSRNTRRSPVFPPRAKLMNSSPNMNNKENIANNALAEESRLPMVLKEMPNKQSIAGSTKAKEDQQKAFMDTLRHMFMEQENKLLERDKNTERQIGQLRQGVQDRLQSFESRIVRQQLPSVSNSTPRRTKEHREVVDATQTAFEAIENVVQKDPNAFAAVRNWYLALSRKYGNHSGLESLQVCREKRSGSTPRKDRTITEKVTLERTRTQFSSPSSQPFSIDTGNFLNRSGLLPGCSQRDKSTMLESVRFAGNKRDYRVPVHQLNEDAYDSYARARERYLPAYEEDDSYYEEDFEYEGLPSAENKGPVVTEPNEDRRKMFEDRARRHNPRL